MPEILAIMGCPSDLYEDGGEANSNCECGFQELLETLCIEVCIVIADEFL